MKKWSIDRETLKQCAQIIAFRFGTMLLFLCIFLPPILLGMYAGAKYGKNKEQYEIIAQMLLDEAKTINTNFQITRMQVNMSGKDGGTIWFEFTDEGIKYSYKDEWQTVYMSVLFVIMFLVIWITLWFLVYKVIKKLRKPKD